MLSEQTVQRLTETVALMVQHYDKVHMDDWCTADRYSDLLSDEECDAVGCLAGFAIAQAGIDEDYTSYAGMANEWLGLTHYQGARLYYTDRWPEQYRTALLCEQPETPAYCAVISDRVEHFIATDGKE